MSTHHPTIPEALSQAARDINTKRPLSEVLLSIAESAKQSMPGVDHVGISVTHRGHEVETLAATDDFVSELDELQYTLNEGPCLDAIWEDGIVVVNHAETDSRWPRYMKEATSRGLRSQMGIRLYTERETLGGLNLYSTHRDELDPETEHVARLFGSHAALALGKAKVEQNMSQAIESRKAIGQAIGIVMERYGLDEERAFQYLTRVSQASNTKLRDVATELVRLGNEKSQGGQPSREQPDRG
jgi:GAF domain-containing protein